MDYKQLRNPGNYRMDYYNVGEVSRTSFAYGEITGFGFESLDPIIPDDTCNVTVEGYGEANNLPIFYHCKTDLFIDEETVLRDSHALKFGAMSFMTGERVKVMLIDNIPAAVVGHGDHKARPCPRVFWLDTWGWGGAYTSRYYDAVHQVETSSVRRLTNVAEKIMGGTPFQWGTSIYYFTDWLFRIGPVLWVWSSRAMGMPMPVTTMVMAYAAPYTKELQEITRTEGQVRDDRYRRSAYMDPNLVEEYPGFTLQTKMTLLIQGHYLGSGGGTVTPRWHWANFYYQDFFRDEGREA